LNEPAQTDGQLDASSFEGVYEQLERAVAQLETGGLSLEESIKVYESGMRLARVCKEMLDAAELRVVDLEQEMAALSAAYPLEDED
jgi:exodeoxyribonuclease VII small subunit